MYFDSDEYLLYNTYYRQGSIYEHSGRYKDAYESYQKAYENIPEDNASLKYTLSGNLMWMLLHIDSFKYSKKLKEHYDMFNKASRYDKSFVYNEFRIAIADIVISLYTGNFYKLEDAYEDAVRLTLPGHISKIQGINVSKQYEDKVKATPESIEFLKSLDVEFLK